MNQWDAKEYHTHSSAQTLWADELLSKLQLKGYEKVLDIGCGDGKITAKIANLLPSGMIVGIDNSLEMIEFARKSFKSSEFPNLEFVHLDILKLTKFNEFDIVFSNACLHWVKDHQKVLKIIYRALKPGGNILLQMGGKGNANEILETIDHIIPNSRWEQYFNNFEFPYGFYGIEEYQQWLDTAGLIANRIELIPKDMVQQGDHGLSGWIRTTWLPYTQRIPESLREIFIGEIVSVYIEDHPIDSNGNIHVKMTRLEVDAKK